MTHIAIDTNIFEHLLNPQWNGDSHIDQLLVHLQKQGVSLCVDSNRRIASEYEQLIIPIIRNREEAGIERYLLSYWMVHCPRREVAVDEQDLRMSRIKSVIHENEAEDRAFVYVACADDCKLVTNDDIHIVSRRQKLKKATKGLRGSATDFVNSRQAVVELVQGGGAA